MIEPEFKQFIAKTILENLLRENPSLRPTSINPTQSCLSTA